MKKIFIILSPCRARLLHCSLFIGILACLTSCNVTRVVTTQSSYYQRGDTTCTIVTKTVESYDATKKLSY